MVSLLFVVDIYMPIWTCPFSIVISFFGYIIVVHNRDGQEVDVAHKIKPPKNQPQFFPDDDGAVLVR